MKAPDIKNVKLTDTANGLILSFDLDEGLEPTNELWLWVRAKIRESNYYQPLDLNIEPGGKSATAIVEPGKVQDDYTVNLEFYFEQYPEREKSEIFYASPAFDPDWFNMSKFEHDLRYTFETMGVEVAAQEACRFLIVPPEDMPQYPNCALDNRTGLWMVEAHPQDDVEDYAGIAPDQPDFGIEWRKKWFPAVLDRSREIRTENGWDDGRNH